jgi:dTDP-4-amino-4,6-dideoxygalactose transaminase
MDFLPFTRPSIDEATISAVGEVLRSGWLTTGPKVAAFEAKLTEYFGRTTRVFSNGTCTMEVALRIAGIGPGDEVITTPITWVATANIILAVGATPKFVDIDPVTRNIDLDKLEAAITPRTKAVIPVYLSGLPVNMDRLYEMAQRRGFRVIEDAAQAQGSRWKGRRIGSFGDFASFSFQANKNLTTGEGGCLVLPEQANVDLAERLRLQGVRRTGFDGMEVEVPGGKFNMNDIAAQIGLCQLEQLADIQEQRKKLASRYFERLMPLIAARNWADCPEPVLPPNTLGHPDIETNWHMFQLVLPLERLAQTKKMATRAQFMEQMKARAIGIGVHYPPVHLFKLYRNLGWKDGDFPVAEKIGRSIVSLPLFRGMSLADVDRVVSTLEEVI